MVTQAPLGAQELNGLLTSINQLRVALFSSVGVIALILYLVFFRTDSLIGIVGCFASLFKWLFRGLRKTQIQNEIKGNILRASKALSQECEGIFPVDMSVKFVSDIQRDAFLHQDKIIIRMSDTNNTERNHIIALAEYVKTGFIPQGKLCYSKPIRTAADIVVMRKIIEKLRNIGLNYFVTEFYPNYIQRDNRLDILYNDLLKVDDNGIFMPILIKHANERYKMIRFPEANEQIQIEFKELTALLIEIATKAPNDRLTQDCIRGMYLKLAFVLAAFEDTDEMIDEHARTICRYINSGIETIYILALGSKIPIAKEIARRAYCSDQRYSLKPEKTWFQKTRRDGRKVNGICIEMSVVPCLKASSRPG